MYKKIYVKNTLQKNRNNVNYNSNYSNVIVLEGLMSFEKVRQLICSQLGKSPEKVTMETKIVEDLGADSLEVVELLMALEDETGISLPDEVAMKLTTVGDIVNYIDSQKK